MLTVSSTIILKYMYSNVNNIVNDQYTVQGYISMNPKHYLETRQVKI